MRTMKELAGEWLYDLGFQARTLEVEALAALLEIVRTETWEEAARVCETDNAPWHPARVADKPKASRRAAEHMAFAAVICARRIRTIAAKRREKERVYCHGRLSDGVLRDIPLPDPSHHSDRSESLESHHDRGVQQGLPSHARPPRVGR